MDVIVKCVPSAFKHGITEDNIKMPDMTDEEYDILDEYWTVNTPKLSGNGKSGFFAKHTGQVVFVDNLSADWLRIKAAAKNTTPDVIISELVRAEIARSANMVMTPA